MVKEGFISSSSERYMIKEFKALVDVINDLKYDTIGVFQSVEATVKSAVDIEWDSIEKFKKYTINELNEIKEQCQNFIDRISKLQVG